MRTGKKSSGGTGGLPPGYPGPAPRNLLILGRFDHSTAKVLGVEAATGSPRKDRLAPVRLTESTYRDYPPGTAELVLAFHDRDGAHLASWGQSARGKVFVDVRDDASPGRHAGGGGAMKPMIEGLQEPAEDLRLFHVTVPKDAGFLAFYRNEVVVRDGGTPPGGTPPGGTPGGGKPEGGKPPGGTPDPRELRLVVKLLGLFPMFWHGDHDPPDRLIVPWTEEALREFRLMDAFLENLPNLGWKRIDVFPGGEITGFETLHGDGDVDSNLNVVILGDGFAAGNDQDLFRARCDLVVAALQSTEPYASYFDKTNIFVVQTESDESGITACPGGAGSRSTYYRVRGSFGGVGYPGYVGSDDVQRIYDAASHFASLDRLDVLLMLTNCPLYGGSAYLNEKVVFANLCDRDTWNNPYPTAEMARKRFQGVCMHEMAHQLGHLGEEYIPTGIVPFDPLDDYPNIVLRTQMHTAPWKQIALGGEIEAATEQFRVIKDCNELSCDHSHNCLKPGETVPWPEQGLFWGAQYTDDAIDPNRFDPSPCQSFSTAKGKDFFRSMAVCRMKHVHWPFCRWCTHVLGNQIANAIET